MSEAPRAITGIVVLGVSNDWLGWAFPYVVVRMPRPIPILNSTAGTLGAVGDGDEAHEEDPSESVRPRLDGFLLSVASDRMVDVDAVEVFLPCLLNARAGTGCRTNFLSMVALVSASLIAMLSQYEGDSAGELAAEEPLSEVSEPASESPLVLLASELLDNSRVIVIGRGCGLAPIR